MLGARDRLMLPCSALAVLLLFLMPSAVPVQAGAAEYCMADDPDCIDTALPEVALDPAETIDDYEYKDYNPVEQLNSQGVAAAQRGHIAEALDLFRAASYHQGHRQDVWANIAIASKDLADRMGPAETRKPRSVAHIYGPPLSCHYEAWDAKLRALAKEGHTLQEYTDAASRSDDRYEVKFPLKSPFIDSDLIANRIMLGLLKTVIGARFEIDTFSYVASRAGAPHQGIVNIVPLVNMTQEVGPTEFMTGSHWPMRKTWKDYDETNSPTPLHRLAADTGSAVLFDVSIYHRGTHNRSPSFRPIVYMSYVREWWFDRVNFKDKQTRDYDPLDIRHKKLMTRLDARPCERFFFLPPDVKPNRTLTLYHSN
ncbi:uncharacterized protein MONBRDRAFT_30313 [Monosiga brevicollis MX1]|uniref:Uncharacterized protein n=1 Tax=Monosiga brevicollis TaxID=81824 RepID=A9VDL8_MONBE|nr:uncharacterized protein MONBRDRAFT_30313 [Monosiga brevicollis MX1]EDQ84417.1 predicted protein [Monosiga brevicollis MX1]|eukprot:XP_001750818.1 hypothetical protein [Monosiga brevicollis MX1]